VTNGDLPADIRDGVRVYASRLESFVREIAWHAEIGSTNDTALMLAERGAPEGTVVGADLQTAGRGRRGRSWASPPGAGLYVSVVLRPDARTVPLVTIAAGVAVADAIGEAIGLAAVLKWPNDVYLGGRKVAGILAEAGSSHAGVHHIVLGVGVNVGRASYPPEVAARATSLEHEVGRPVDRGLVLGCCLAALGARYREAGSDPPHVLAAWRRYAESMLRRPVTCHVGGGTVSGIAAGIDDQGALLVRAGADTVRVVSGEVIWH